MAVARPVAVIISVVGKAYVRHENGELVELKTGDILLEGQVVITSADGRVELDFGGGSPFSLQPNQTVQMTAELSESLQPSIEESALQEDSFAQIVQTLENGGDLDAVIEAPGAGPAGSNDSGNNFVRLTNIIEELDPAQILTSQAVAEEILVDDPFQTDDLLGDDNATATTTSTVTVGDVNDGPTITAENGSIDEDSGSVTVAFTAADVDGTIVSTTATVPADQGTVVVNDDGTYTFTPAENFFGDATVTLVTIDNDNATATTTSTVTVGDVNDETVVVADTATINEDNSVDISVLTNDTDVDGNAATLVSATNGTNGTTTVNAATGVVTYTPNADFSGTDTFTYENSEGNSESVTVNIVAVADAPTLHITSDVVTAQSITVDNVTDNTGGYQVTALASDGSLSTISINTSPVGFGVTGRASGADSELGYSSADGASEQIVIDFDAPISSIDISFAWKNASENAIYTFYNNGEEVGTGISVGGNDRIDPAVTLKPLDGLLFDQVVFTAPAGGNHDYLIHSIDYEKIDVTTAPIVIDEGSSVGLNIASSLSDTDGSESLEISIKDIPEGFTISDGINSFTANTTSTSIDITNWDLNNLTLGTMDVDATTVYTLHVVSTSTESANSDNASTTLPVEVTVVSQNELSVLLADTATTNEDVAVDISVLANDTDVDGNAATLVSATNGTNGTTTVNAITGVVTYTPNSDFFGTDTFTYTNSENNSASVTVTVNPLNDAPVANVESVTVVEDGSVEIDVLLNDTDLDGTIDPTTVTITTQPIHGTVSVNGTTGEVTYAPTGDYNGADSFAYTVKDNDGTTSAPATVSLTVTDVNDPPDAVNDNLSTSGAGEVLVSENFEGGAEGWNDNTTTETAGNASNFLGRFGGSNGEEAVSKVFNLGVEHAGESVIIKFDMYEIDSWDDEFFNVFVNGEEVASDAMSHFGRTWSNLATDEEDGGEAIDNIGSSGAPHLDNDEVHSYEVQAIVDSNGEVKLGFGSTLNQSLSDESYGIDNLVISSGADWSSQSSATEDTAMTIYAADILANDSDVDGDVITLTAVNASDDTHGTVSLDQNGNVIFTPDADYNGEASFTYTIEDGKGGTDTATVSFNVDAVNDAPVATDLVFTAAEDTPLNVVLTATDVENDIDHFVINVLPTDGVLYSHYVGEGNPLNDVYEAGTEIIATNGQAVLVFVPVANESGSDAYAGSDVGNQQSDYARFDYVVFDVDGNSDNAMVTIDVTPVADTPTLTITDSDFNYTTDVEEFTYGGTWTGNALATGLTGGIWHTDNPDGKIEIGQENTYLKNQVTTNDVVELEGNRGDSSNLYTVISAEAGETYQLSFQFSPRSGHVNDSTIYVKLTDTENHVETLMTLESDTVALQDYSLTIPVSATGTYRLEFVSADQNSTGGVLDNIQLEQLANTGIEGELVRLSTISAGLNDDDESELLAIHISGIPNGAILSDGIHSGTGEVDVVGWDLTNLTISGLEEGTYELTVTASAKEVSNGQVAETSDIIEVTILTGSGYPSIVNDPTVIVDDVVETVEDSAIEIFVLNNDTDTDGNNATLVSASNGAHGTTSVDTATGIVTYTPAADYTGADSFTYTNSEGNIGIVTVSVTPEPFLDAVDDTVVAVEDTVFTSVIDLDANDMVSSGLELSVVPGTFTTFQGGSVVLAADGSYTYTPALNFSGSDSVDYTVTDGVSTDVGKLTIDVTPVADSLSPTAGNASIVIGNPLVNTGILNADLDENAATDVFEYKGLVITSSTDVLNFTPGLGIGIETSNNDANQLDYGEVLSITLPNSVTSLALQVKSIVDEEIVITAKGQDGSTIVWTFMDVKNSLADVATRTITDANGDLVSTVDVSTDMLLANGNASDHLTLTSPIAFTHLTIVDNNVAGGGFSLENISDPNAASTGFTYPVEINGVLQDVDGSEAITEVSLSGFPEDSVLTFVDVNGDTVNINPSSVTADGSDVFELDPGLLVNFFDGTTFVDNVYLTTPEILDSAFKPTMMVTTGEESNGSEALTIIGGTDSSTLSGGSGNDYIDGGDGDDIISGGEGDDQLIGGLGADTFKWELNDLGSTDKPANDTVMDFDTVNDSDALDLGDILSNVESDNLDSYLHFEQSGNDTVVHVSSTGDLANAEDQTITLNDVSMDSLTDSALTDIAGDSLDATIIADMINNGKLITD